MELEREIGKRRDLRNQYASPYGSRYANSQYSFRSSDTSEQNRACQSQDKWERKDYYYNRTDNNPRNCDFPVSSTNSCPRSGQGDKYVAQKPYDKRISYDTTNLGNYSSLTNDNGLYTRRERSSSNHTSQMFERSKYDYPITNVSSSSPGYDYSINISNSYYRKEEEGSSYGSQWKNSSRNRSGDSGSSNSQKNDARNMDILLKNISRNSDSGTSRKYDGLNREIHLKEWDKDYAAETQLKNWDGCSGRNYDHIKSSPNPVLDNRGTRSWSKEQQNVNYDAKAKLLDDDCPVISSTCIDLQDLDFEMEPDTTTSYRKEQEQDSKYRSQWKNRNSDSGKPILKRQKRRGSRKSNVGGRSTDIYPKRKRNKNNEDNTRRKKGDSHSNKLYDNIKCKNDDPRPNLVVDNRGTSLCTKEQQAINYDAKALCEDDGCSVRRSSGNDFQDHDFETKPDTTSYKKKQDGSSYGSQLKNSDSGRPIQKRRNRKRSSRKRNVGGRSNIDPKRKENKCNADETRRKKSDNYADKHYDNIKCKNDDPKPNLVVDNRGTSLYTKEQQAINYDAKALWKDDACSVRSLSGNVIQDHDFEMKTNTTSYRKQQGGSSYGSRWDNKESRDSCRNRNADRDNSLRCEKHSTNIHPNDAAELKKKDDQSDRNVRSKNNSSKSVFDYHGSRSRIKEQQDVNCDAKARLEDDNCSVMSSSCIDLQFCDFEMKPYITNSYTKEQEDGNYESRWDNRNSSRKRISNSGRDQNYAAETQLKKGDDHSDRYVKCTSDYSTPNPILDNHGGSSCTKEQQNGDCSVINSFHIEPPNHDFETKPDAESCTVTACSREQESGKAETQLEDEDNYISMFIDDTDPLIPDMLPKSGYSPLNPYDEKFTQDVFDDDGFSQIQVYPSVPGSIEVQQKSNNEGNLENDVVATVSHTEINPVYPTIQQSTEEQQMWSNEESTENSEVETVTPAQETVFEWLSALCNRVAAARQNTNLKPKNKKSKKPVLQKIRYLRKLELEKYSRILKLKPNTAYKLLQPDGVVFLKILSERTNLQINAHKEDGKNGLEYWCTLEGPEEQIPKAREAIIRFCNPYQRPEIYALGMKPINEFSRDTLRRNFSKLNDSGVDWAKITRELFQKMVSIEVQIEKRKILLQEDQFRTGRHRTDCKRVLKRLTRDLGSRYIALNMIILGKLEVEDAPQHIQVLKQWLDNGKEDEVKDSVMESYNYMFKNCTRLNINYDELIDKLPRNEKYPRIVQIEHAFHTGIAECLRYKGFGLLTRLKDLYNSVIIDDFSDESVQAFTNYHMTLKGSRK